MKMLYERRYIKKAFVMVQKEVQERLCAKPGIKLYGKISVFYQMFADLSLVCTVSKTCFYPMPKVDSAILEMKFYENPKVPLKDEALFFALVKQAFSQRRKKIINTLDGFLGLDKVKVREILEENNVKIDARAEDLSYNEYAMLLEKANCEL